MSFAVRGVVEGFYGTPWTHAQRINMIEFLGRHQMNAYMYAPKDDLLHREHWRTPYAAEQIEQFGELARHGSQHGVRFGFAISPGLDIDYESNDDRTVLLAKCVSVQTAGVVWFLLALDDIPMADGLAPRQAALAKWLLSALRDHNPQTSLMVCPTEYLGTTASRYTKDLVATLPRDIALMWTGPTVCSPTISTEDAASWRSAFPNHDLIIWDNYPVNDGAMASRMHLGPYRGRSHDLATVVDGILLNPMNQPAASQIPLATAAAYLADPAAYDADAAFINACPDDQTAVIARACFDGPCNPPSTLPLAQAIGALITATGTATDARDNERAIRVRDNIRGTLLFSKTAAKKSLVAATGFATEIAPWAQRIAVECRAGIAALNVLDLCDESNPEPDVLAIMGAMFALSFHWAQARRSEHVVFGPRFALYPAIVMHHSGQPTFRAREGILEDCNAIDALCRIACAAADRASEQ